MGDGPNICSLYSMASVFYSYWTLNLVFRLDPSYFSNFQYSIPSHEGWTESATTTTWRTTIGRLKQRLIVYDKTLHYFFNNLSVTILDHELWEVRNFLYHVNNLYISQ